MFEQLYQNLTENNLIDNMNNIILSVFEDGSIQAIDKPTFEIFFKDVSNSISYDSYIGSHTFMWDGVSVTYTTEQMGYKVIFDSWKQKGILQ